MTWRTLTWPDYNADIFMDIDTTPAKLVQAPSISVNNAAKRRRADTGDISMDHAKVICLSRSRSCSPVPPHGRSKVPKATLSAARSQSDDSVDAMQGASHTTGGVIRGRAQGNVLNMADIGNYFCPFSLSQLS